MYITSEYEEMANKRGCFSSVYHAGFVYAFGGINYTDKMLKRCERLNLETNKWQPIASMNECRKNASACTFTSETIYVFGGNSNSTSLDSIEQYSVTTNKWTKLKVRLPHPLSFMSCMKLTDATMLIMGGSRKEIKP